jgi:hypothetical protein
MKFILIYYFLITNAFANTNLELLQLMTNAFTRKEIANNKSLCNDFKYLYEHVDRSDRPKFQEITCSRFDPLEDAEVKSAKYLKSIDSQINIIQTTSSEISEAKIQIITNSIAP